ncbi:heme NO-binding domain-containing protein [Rubritalea marina]|uniref:heme NO-binding domain-containing protein n=1 Tax=Rubritalea marina TaxID=361055 RepID=UPI00037C5B6D|nr:heme NO-binding domain-containing protein [Rubritalea marina]
MKGVIFTEFLSMVETAHGLDMVDTIIEKSDLPSGGSYTAVGTYPHTEIVSLVINLSQEIDTPVPDLLKAYGIHLFHFLSSSYPDFVNNTKEPLDFLEQVETYIHVEVRKLYPDAELPSFECSRPNSPNELHMTYHSVRHMEDVCEGLIRGSLQHFNRTADIKRQSVDDDSELFIITLTN